MFGVLAADPDYLSADTAAGLRLAMINIGWDEWEPEQGSFDDAYISQQAATVADAGDVHDRAREGELR